MFLHLSVILFTGGGVSVWCHFLSGCQGRGLCLGVSVQSLSVQSGVSLHGRGVSVGGVSRGSLSGASLSGGSLSARPPPPYGKERPVRILLECILVFILHQADRINVSLRRIFVHTWCMDRFRTSILSAFRMPGCVINCESSTTSPCVSPKRFLFLPLSSDSILPFSGVYWPSTTVAMLSVGSSIGVGFEFRLLPAELALLPSRPFKLERQIIATITAN